MTTTKPERKAETGSPVAEVVGAVRRYPGVLALDNVNFSVHRGEIRALLGRNGAGKSTLIRLLSGAEQPDEGTVFLDGEVLGSGGIRGASARGIATVYQELSLVPEMSIAENIMLGRWPRTRRGIDLTAMRRKSAEALEVLGVGLDPRREVGSLTLAEQQIVEIARAVREGPKLLILDEPTSALAMHEVAIVLDTVRRVAAAGMAVIYVSHRMDEIRQVAQSATIMRDGKIVETVDVREASTARIVELMVGASERTVTAVDKAVTVGRTLLAVENLVLEPKLAGATFEVRAGEVLGIAGLLGTGRTELLRAIAGFDPPTSGTISVDGSPVGRINAAQMRRRGIGMTPEDRKAEGILPDLGVDVNILISDFSTVSRAGVLDARAIRDQALALVERLKIKVSKPSIPIGTLSGGNQQKAVIARWLHAGSRVLLLDDPTRGVDVEAKSQIYTIMRSVAASGAAVVFVSSEIEELPLACDRVLVLHAGRFVCEFSAPDIDIATLLTATMAVGPDGE